MDRDLNLLFGVVAVEYEQVTSSDFVRAVEAWANEPNENLSTYLVQAGVLSESDREFVNDLVDKALNECDGDPEAALESVGGDEALHISSRGCITLIGSHGLKVGPPEQHRTEPLEGEAVEDGESSLAPNAVETEVVAWRLIGFVVFAFVLLSAFAVYPYWRIVEGRNEVAAARDVAEGARQIAEEQLSLAKRRQHLHGEALLVAEDARTTLERERNNANRQKDLALAGIKRMVFELPGRLAAVPEANPISRALLEENIAVLDSILRLEPDSIDLRIERSANQALIGSLWRRLGDATESVAAHERALAISSGLSEQRPETIRHQLTVARRHLALGAAYSDIGSYDKALVALETSVRINEELLEPEFDDYNLRVELAKAYTAVGNVQNIRGLHTRSVESYEKSLDFNEKLLESEIQYGAPSRVIESQDMFGIYERAVGHWRKSLESDVGDRETHIGLAQSEQNLGLVCAYYGSYEEARRKLESSLSTYSVFSGGPLQTDGREGQARVYYEMALIHTLEGDFGAAKEAYGLSIANSEDLASAWYEAGFRHRLAGCRFALGRLHLSLGEYERASAQFGMMLEIYKRPSARDAVLPSDTAPLYRMYKEALEELRHADRGEEALRLRETYIGLLGYFAQRGPDDEPILSQLADAYVDFGITLRRDEQTERARESFQSALAILEGLAAKDPNDRKLTARISPIQNRLSRIDEVR